jgi:hypothetical protein
MTCVSMPLLRTCYREVTTAQAPPGIGPLTGDVHHEAADRSGGLGRGTLRWLDLDGLLCFAREPGFILAANLGVVPAPLPAHREILLASGPVTNGTLSPNTAAWLSS